MKKKPLICAECDWVFLESHDQYSNVLEWCPRCMGNTIYFDKIFLENFNEKMLSQQPYWIERKIYNLKGEEREKRRKELEVLLKKEILKEI